jgi:hypothetical protein
MRRTTHVRDAALVLVGLLLLVLWLRPWGGARGSTEVTSGAGWAALLEETTTSEPPPTDTLTPLPPPTDTVTPPPPATDTLTPPPPPTDTLTPPPPTDTPTTGPTLTSTPVTPTVKPTKTNTTAPTKTKTPTITPTRTKTPKPTKTVTPVGTVTVTPTLEGTPTPTLEVTLTPGTTVKVEGYVWGDRNDDQQRQAGEGLLGMEAKLELQGSSPSDVKAQETDATNVEGYYHFDSVSPGVYRLQISDWQGRLPTHVTTVDARDPAGGTIRVDVRYGWLHAPVVERRPTPTATNTPPVTATPVPSLTPTPGATTCVGWVGDWGDEFDDDHLSRWGVKAGDGVVEVDDSVLHLYSVEGQSSRFPILWASPTFPSDAWLLEIRFRYGMPTVYGTGVGVGTGRYDGRRYSDDSPAPANIEDILSIHQNAQEWRISLWGTVVLGGNYPEMDWHLLQLEKVGNVYRLGLDGMLVAVQTHEGNPKSIWLGNPTEQYYWNLWTPLNLDYVRLSRCSAYGSQER